MPKHAGQSRPSDTQIADQAAACADEIRAWMRRIPLTPAATIDDRVESCNLLGRALALLEIMAGDK